MFQKFTLLLMMTVAVVGLSWVETTAAPVSERAGVSIHREPEVRVPGSVPLGELTTPDLIEAARASGRIDEDTALLYTAYALGDYEQLPVEYRSDAAWRGTVPLLELEEAVRTIQSSRAVAAVRGVLRGACSGGTALSLESNTTNFHVEYDSVGGGLTIDDYTASLETNWATQVTSFGWAAPPVLGSNPPPGNRYHVRVEPLGGGLYGFVSQSGDHAGFVGDNPNTTWNEGDAYASCMVLNSDFSQFPGTAQTAMDATMAHEFNHSIQFGYGVLTGANEPDFALSEGGATWMEDEVFDSSNDNYGFLWPVFVWNMGQYAGSPYAYWITWRGLTERYGTGIAGGGEDVMQDFWEETSKSSGSNMLSALSTALANKGTTLADAYHAYAIAVKFNRACGGGYVYPYCFEEGPAYVGAVGATSVHGTIAVVGDASISTVEDNYALRWVSLPTSGDPYDVTLENTSSGGALRASLVCDTGAALEVSALPSIVGAGDSTTFGSFDPAGCSSVVAVITNQSQTADNPTFSTPRSYLLSTAAGTGTSTPTPTETATPPTSTPTPASLLDTDGDGCTDVQEQGSDVMLGGLRDPDSFWDFFDVWTGSPSGRDRVVNIADIGGVVARFGTSIQPGPTLADALDQARRAPADASSYHAAFDRGGTIPGQNLWNLSPPDGVVGIGDIGAVVAQFGHSCA